MAADWLKSRSQTRPARLRHTQVQGPHELLARRLEPRTGLCLSIWGYPLCAVLLTPSHVQVSFFDPLLQSDREVRAGRMECTMQNLADSLTVRTPQRLASAAPAAATAAAAAAAAAGNGSDGACEELSTFMVYNLRRKVCDGRWWRRWLLTGRSLPCMLLIDGALAAQCIGAGCPVLGRPQTSHCQSFPAVPPVI